MTTAHSLLPDTLITPEWLQSHLDDPNLVVLDCTVGVDFQPDGGFRIFSGRDDYNTVHIPGAGFADLLTDLSDPDKTGWVPMPTPERFCAAMGALGVGDESTVVLYDGNGRMWSARVWWMLRWVGFDRVAILDGGLDLWMAEGRPVSTAPASYPVRSLTPRLRPNLIAHRAEILAALEQGAVDSGALCLVDTLDAQSYRAQRIPGATHFDAMQLLDNDGTYRTDDELAAMFDGAQDTRTVTYCGGGVAAASAAFVLHRLGYRDVAVYAASLQEWLADPANPLETESALEAEA